MTNANRTVQFKIYRYDPGWSASASTILRMYCMFHCYNIMNCNDVCSRELNWVKLIGKFNE